MLKQGSCVPCPAKTLQGVDQFCPGLTSAPILSTGSLATYIDSVADGSSADTSPDDVNTEASTPSENSDPGSNNGGDFPFPVNDDDPFMSNDDPGMSGAGFLQAGSSAAALAPTGRKPLLRRQLQVTPTPSLPGAMLADANCAAFRDARQSIMLAKPATVEEFELQRLVAVSGLGIAVGSLSGLVILSAYLLLPVASLY